MFSSSLENEKNFPKNFSYISSVKLKVKPNLHEVAPAIKNIFSELEL